MAFTDRVRIHVEGGHGGGGCVSFRREARTPKGGPDGGNGGRGGSVYLVADPAVEDLSRFRHAVHHKAKPGQPGSGRKRHGRSGADAQIPVPIGTRVIRDDATIAVLDAAGATAEVARGGDGGVGNWAFRSSTHQAPRESVPGAPGDETWLTLELRLPVDVAIVGLPNSGKSALLRALTGAPALVAAYPRSTREPGFGPLEDDAGHLYLVADLPGVDEHGAPRADGRLGQLERATVILHCVDASDPEEVADRIARVRATLREFASPDAVEIVVATHTGTSGADDVGDVAVDSEAGRGIDELRERILATLARSG